MPDEVVVVSVTWFVVLLRMEILAPGTTAPDGSVTVPWILPVEMVVWAKVRTESTKAATKHATSKLYCLTKFNDMRVFINPSMFVKSRGLLYRLSLRSLRVRKKEISRCLERTKTSCLCCATD